jgi:hypothetical protein
MNNLSIGLSFIADRGKKSQHIEGRRVLRLLDQKYFPELYHTEKILETGKEKSGRPFFTDFHANFSISHSRNMVAAAYTPSAFRLGCDIQYIDERKNLNGVAERAFSPADRDYALNSAERFYQIWTLKESYVKLRGLSVFAMRGLPDFTDRGTLRENIFLENEKIIFDLYYLETNSGDRYALALAQKDTFSTGAPALIRFAESSMFHVKHFRRIGGNLV